MEPFDGRAAPTPLAPCFGTRAGTCVRSATRSDRVGWWACWRATDVRSSPRVITSSSRRAAGAGEPGAIRRPLSRG